MSHREIIEKLVRDHTVETALTRGSKAREDIRALQRVLCALGFDSELNWQKYGADGNYGSSTAAAVAAFAAKNGLAGDGRTVTAEMAEILLARYDILDDLRCLNTIIGRREVEKRICFGSIDRVAVRSVQTLLYELGFAKQLNWEKYGADGYYGQGTVKALQAFADQEGIACNGSRRLRPDLAGRMIQQFNSLLGAHWAVPPSESPESTVTAVDLTVRKVVEKARPRLYVSDGVSECRFTQFKKGVYFFGRQRAQDFIRSHSSDLADLGLTESVINVMAAVSENEGNMDAVNTWDNSFMTFGMFQWTVGAGGSKGELPALLKKIKDRDAGIFEHYYGRYGLDIADTDHTYGYFLMNGKKMADPEAKEALRSNQWAFYFWRSAQDPVVQSIQIQHAASRLDTFYRSARYKINGHFIADLITSEYGVGLIMDNHVNRPGYVAPCLKAALERSGLDAPRSWGTDEERRLIDRYIDIRNSYGRSPMTDAAKRAAVTKRYLDKGLISADRGSYRHAVSTLNT
jgi:peptidoglycan hydrolase-like protein with peptidoglycan-binding domain